MYVYICSFVLDFRGHININICRTSGQNMAAIRETAILQEFFSAFRLKTPYRKYVCLRRIYRPYNNKKYKKWKRIRTRTPTEPLYTPYVEFFYKNRENFTRPR